MRGSSLERERVRLASPLNLEATLESGQVFHWRRGEPGEGFYGCIGEELVRVAVEGGELRVTPAEAVPLVEQYFALDEDWEAILGTFPQGDETLAEAVRFCPGLRMVRQPLWECLATFLTSSLKQVAHIRQISLQVRERFGEERRLGSWRAHSYPAPERLAAVVEAELRACGMGYRARPVRLAAQRLASGEVDLEAGRALDDADLHAFLKGFYGVGDKIAHCVMLFGYGRMAAFPVDVWMERVLRERYFGGEGAGKVKRAELEEFAVRHFGKNGGYAQQFLFHYARTGWRKSGWGA